MSTRTTSSRPGGQTVEPVGVPPASTNGSTKIDAERKPSKELIHALAEVKGQAQFLLYLADQIQDSIDQLANEADPGHRAFLCKVLGMYSSHLETKHQGLGEKIAETCQELYVTLREWDAH